MKFFGLFFTFVFIAVTQVFGQNETDKVYGIDDPQVHIKPKLVNELEAQRWLYYNNQYLSDKKELGNLYKVTIVFTIDSMGNLHQPFIIKGIGKPFDSEAIRLIHELPFEWTPAQSNGKNINAKAQFTIGFLKKDASKLITRKED